ncbi:methyltransferase, FkbM family [Hymenobacter gelipurpurascens]|uniref:Methyltransferase, FkbM family n=2 Tax=Hymenobacter gelipurpurascens TaxID=89968 RepID=A0A212TCS5_9BACT|nr:methyltransferase, FkbM family [Hymenobacter gelipurpurascens]
MRKNLNLRSLRMYHKGRFFIYDVNGFNMASESFSWYLHKYLLEQDVTNISGKFYRPCAGDVVLDIGAGLGEETCIYADLVSPKGAVYAVEANPMVYEVLQEVIKLNNFTNVHLFNIAISEQQELVRIDDAPDTYLASSLNNVKKGTIYEVQGLPLHEFCSFYNIHQIDLLKVNIEGAERYLATAFERPELDIRHVAISCHNFRFTKEGNEFFRTKALVSDYLKRNGYAIISQCTGTDYIDDWVYGTKMR